jgi:hypothetical protein
MTDEIKKAFDFAAELTKQLITLATAIIGAVVTFLDKTHLETKLNSCAFTAALVSYLVSIIFGALTLMALTGNLATATAAAPATPYAPNVRILSAIQIIAFLVATGLAIFVTVPR